MEQYLRRTWAEVELDAVAHNYHEIKQLAGDAECLCIVKADAYGHGAVAVARELYNCGARFFGVSNIEEALQLREGGLSGQILILGYTPPELADVLVVNDITQTVFSAEYAAQLSSALRSRRLKVHIKLDTGMSRLGLTGGVEAQADAAAKICSYSQLICEGIFTHFARADEVEDSNEEIKATALAQTEHQFGLFSEITELLKKRGIEFLHTHCCNSAALLKFPQYKMNMVRPGLILYGVSPFANSSLIPAMSLKTVVSQTKELKQGASVSYGGTFVMPHDGRLAVLPCGYADGFGRLLSGRAQLIINGRRINQIGNICMDMCMADITDTDIKEGDTAVIIGRQGNETITADDIAKLTGTISYEVLCLVGKRVARVYLRNGEIVASSGLLGN